MPAEVLDTVVAAETPEGILLELRPAGLVPRFYAFALDGIIRIAVMYAAGILSAMAGGVGMAFFFILFFGMEWLYPVVFELSQSGATPGKRAFGLRVVMDNGLPITPAASLARNLLRAADFLPFFYGAAIVSMLVRHDAKRLGDLAAGTIVVHEPRPSRRIELHDVAPLMPAVALTQDARAAIIALAGRAPSLTEERLDELAALAARVSGDAGRSGPAVTRRILGVAQWALGERP